MLGIRLRYVVHEGIQTIRQSTLQQSGKQAGKLNIAFCRVILIFCIPFIPSFMEM